MTPADGRCACWGTEAHPHSGHCCFGRRPGESSDDTAARWARHDTGEEPLCHGEYVGGPPGAVTS